MTQQNFGQRLNGFVDALQDYQNGLYANEKYLAAPRIETEQGMKFVRIVSQNMDPRGIEGQRMVYCFIDMSNGDILKAEGWKKPAKGKRGSIFNDGFDVGDGKPCDRYGGGLYIRR